MDITRVTNLISQELFSTDRLLKLIVLWSNYPI